MIRPGLLAWQWSDYAAKHQNRLNLLLHAARRHNLVEGDSQLTIAAKPARRSDLQNCAFETATLWQEEKIRDYEWLADYGVDRSRQLDRGADSGTGSLSLRPTPVLWAGGKV